jgi:hypothetical protein
MEAEIQASNASWVDSLRATSWGSIAAGAVVACAASLALFGLGAGLGLSAISPYGDSGISASTFKWTSGAYLVLVSVMSSALGGYLAARLRAKWVSIHTHEAFFRDTANGLVAWAFATVLSAAVLGGAVTHIVGGVASGLLPAAQGASTADPSRVFVDRLFRSDTAPANPAANTEARGEILRLWTSSTRTGELSSDDKAYVARVVASQTGLSQQDATKRVDDVIAQAKAAADQARRAAASLAFWLTAALLFGAFAASLAAVEGGQLRDGTWEGTRLRPRPW